MIDNRMITIPFLEYQRLIAIESVSQNQLEILRERNEFEYELRDLKIKYNPDVVKKLIDETQALRNHISTLESEKMQKQFEIDRLNKIKENNNEELKQMSLFQFWRWKNGK